MTLAEFLLARIAEDETNGRQLQHFERWTIDSDVKPEIETFANPARVLAECEAKRRIVRALQSAEVSGSADYELGFGLDLAARILAAVCADHPDYREEWKP